MLHPVLFGCAHGLRRAELASLNEEDYKLLEDEAELWVRGKDDKGRKAYLFNGALDAMRGWLEARGGEPRRLFCRINEGGVISPRKKLSGEALRLILEKLWAEA